MTESANTSDTEASAAQGLKGSVQALMATVLAIFQTRLALLSTELEEEKQRLLATMAWGAVAILLGSFALMFVALFVAVLFWDSHRLLALGSMAAVFAAMAAWAVWRVRQLTAASAQPLEATLAELEADRQALIRRTQP